MIDAAVTALIQMFSPLLRRILWRAIGLALILIVVIAIALQRLMSWLADIGGVTIETALGGFHEPLAILTWLLSIAAGLGIIVGSVFLMPAVTSLVASIFVDDVADVVERQSYPAEQPGAALSLPRSLVEGTRTALISVLVYILALPLLLFAGLGFVIFFVATAWLLSREYFELAAMRFRSPAEARAMRKHFRGQLFVAGLIIAAFVSIPIVNLATPIFAMAFMVHMHKRLSGPRPEVIAPAPRPAFPANGTDR